MAAAAALTYCCHCKLSPFLGQFPPHFVSAFQRPCLPAFTCLALFD
ncbi:hypothetical protein SLEP1_g57630 [Rubroshorea leprosula]|uniref:Uncharacterized protein n=1 Tax=Rubroshorea leprosula TaxID=152421 RepID=A0AAV5MNH1_9ROSI|nr:hypothetical protein SLEP1_g57630 [Rubroshorea leprosula]